MPRFKTRVSVGQLGVTGGTGTSTAAAVTINASAGVITTESLTTAAAAVYTFTLTNSHIAATDIVLATVSTTGTGTPVVAEITPAAGTCVIIVQNIHASAAFNAVLKISFVVVKQ